MKITREEIGGAVGAAIFSVLLLLVLLFSFFEINAHADELEGVPVMFGSMEDAFGEMEPPYEDFTPEPRVEPEVAEYSPEAPLITQDVEETINVAARREEEQRRRQQEEQRRIEEEARRKREEEQRRQNEINKQMAGLFGEEAGSRGETEGTGTQGVSTGSSTEGAASGLGGRGSYDLGGRSLGRGGLQLPSYSADDYGKIVVDIIVDPQGNVIQADIGRGTDTPNSALRNEALRAARRTKFNAINSVNNQKGTITYNFTLK